MAKRMLHPKVASCIFPQAYIVNDEIQKNVTSVSRGKKAATPRSSFDTTNVVGIQDIIASIFVMVEQKQTQIG